MNRLLKFDEMTAQSRLFSSNGQDAVCLSCAHKCRLQEGKRGVCGFHFNKGGRIYSPRGYVSSIALDPIEKKPLYHFLPGQLSLSFGMFGCNFKCPFCQNYSISQILPEAGGMYKISSGDIIAAAFERKVKMVVSTYNEPFITCDWAREIFEKAKKKNFKTVFVSNGFASAKALDFISPVLDAINIDLKSFSDATYKMVIGGRLKDVIACIEGAVKKGVWTEITTLLVPDLNDTEEEIRQIARFIKSVSPAVPWHVSAFHPDYKMLNASFTPAETLLRAKEIGLQEGLKHIYIGNLPLPGAGDTLCPNCGKRLIARSGFEVVENACRIEKTTAKCPDCGEEIKGVWL